MTSCNSNRNNSLSQATLIVVNIIKIIIIITITINEPRDFPKFTYLFFLYFLRLSLSLPRFVTSLSGSFLERPDLLMPYMSGFSSHSRTCLTLTFVSVLWFELLLWKLSLCAGASDFSDFSESEPDPEPELLEELESLR